LPSRCSMAGIRWIEHRRRPISIRAIIPGSVFSLPQIPSSARADGSGDGAGGKPACRRLVEMQRGRRMALHDGSRMLRTDRSLHYRAHRLGLAGVRYRQHQPLAGHDLVNRHRDGAHRYGVEVLEPSLAQLLTAARLVELDEDVGIGGFEIRRWVVEGEMAVLADAGKADMDVARPDRAVQPLALCCGVGRITGNHLELPDAADLVEEALLQVAAEARRMGSVDADIFVEMKGMDAAPIDVGRHQRPKHLELARARRENDIGLALGSYGTMDRFGALGGGGASQLGLVGIDRDIHGGLCSLGILDLVGATRCVHRYAGCGPAPDPANGPDRKALQPVAIERFYSQDVPPYERSWSERSAPGEGEYNE